MDTHGTAFPGILYGVDVWCAPTHKETEEGTGKGSAGAIRKLATTQRQGALAVRGGLRTSPNDALDAHASLLQMHLRIDRAAIRIAVLPTVALTHCRNSICSSGEEAKTTQADFEYIDSPHYSKSPSRQGGYSESVHAIVNTAPRYIGKNVG